MANGGRDAVHNALVSEYHSGLWQDPVAPLRMWRTENMKYVECYCGDHELYDLSRDPAELENRVDDPDYGEIRECLKRDLYQWISNTSDDWPNVEIPPPLPEK